MIGMTTFHSCKQRNYQDSTLQGRAGNSKYRTNNTTQLEKQIRDEFGIIMERYISTSGYGEYNNCPLPDYNRFLVEFIKKAKEYKVKKRSQTLTMSVQKENAYYGWINPDNWGPDFEHEAESEITVGSRSWDWAAAYLHVDLDIKYVEYAKLLERLTQAAYNVEFKKSFNLGYDKYVQFLWAFSEQAKKRTMKKGSNTIKCYVDSHDYEKSKVLPELRSFIVAKARGEFEADYSSGKTFADKLLNEGFRK